MLHKYTVEYTTKFKNHAHLNHFGTDDPVTCEEFIEDLLERGYGLRSIKHDGLELSQKDSDRMVKAAASMLASRRICASLGIKSEEEKYRFGFAA